jgi:hypothetical protein
LAIVKQLVEAQDGNGRAASPIFRASDSRGFGARIVMMF